MANEKQFKLSVILSAIDKMSTVVDKAVNSTVKKLDKVSKASQGIGKQATAVGKSAGAMALGIGAALAAPIKLASDFETGMQNVATIIDTNTESIDAMGKQLLAVSTRVPVSIDDLTSALYDVRSAGISADKAMGVLETSAQLATAGLSTTKEATNIMTSSLNAFASEGLTAGQTADILFKTVKAGKTTISELSQAFGAVAPTMQAAGVKLADFQAATAALTTIGVPASQAQNQLRAAVVSLEKPTKDMQKIFQAIGVKDGRELIKTSGGLGAAFKSIDSTAKKMGINLGVAASSVEATSAITAIAGSVNESYTNTLNDMMGGSNALNTAFEKQKQTTAAQFQTLKNNGAALAIQIGQILLPVLNEVMSRVLVFARYVQDLAQRYPNLTKAIVIGALALGTFAAVASGIGFVIGGISTAITGLVGGFKFLVSGIGLVTKAFNVLRIAALTNPVLLIITAIAVGALLIYQYWEPISGWFSGMWDSWGDTIKKFWEYSKTFFKWFTPVGLIYNSWKGMPSFFGTIWGGVKGSFSTMVGWLSNIGSVFYEAGKNIIYSIWEGIKAVFWYPVQAIADLTEEMRSYLPFSPAKSGAFRDLHKVKIVETMMTNFDAKPAVNAVAGMTAQIGAELDVNGGGTGIGAVGGGVGGGGSVSISFSPTINIGAGAGDSEEIKTSIMDVLRQSKSELVRLIQIEQARQLSKRF